MAAEIISRAEAMARGLPRYFDGKPCKHGHVAERFVYKYECVECSRLRHAAFRANRAKFPPPPWEELRRSRPESAPQHETHVAAYAAGLFDGEGHIAIIWHKAGPTPKRRYPRYHLSLSMSQNNWEVIVWLSRTFGGSVRMAKVKKGIGRIIDGELVAYNYHAERWSWVLSGGQAGLFLEATYPYLIVKRREADIALAFQQTMAITGRRRVDPEINDFRARCWEEIRRVRGSKNIRPPWMKPDAEQDSPPS